MEKKRLEELILYIGLDPSSRGEMLSIDSFAQLSNVLLQEREAAN
jgi:hypothetical protein